MMRRLLLTLVITVFTTVAFAGNDDILITRDGAMINVKLVRINQEQVVFIDLKHKRKGELKAPADFVYMVWREKGYCLCFDENGEQTTLPTHKIEKKETTLFLNNGNFFTVYNLSVNKDNVAYQMKPKKKAPYYKSDKSEVFMVLSPDGTTTLYNNKYIEKSRRKKATQTQTMPQTSLITPPSASTASQNTTDRGNTVDATPSIPTSAPNAENGFYPAPDMSPQELETKINAIQPYTLFRKGSMAEYVIETDGVRGRFFGGPTYVQQVVQEEKIENGLLVAYIQQLLFNKKHEPSKGISEKFKSFYYPTEIDSAGNFHLTHDISRDFMIISKRNGYAMLVPGDVKAGDKLNCSSIHDTAKNMFGSQLKVKAEYSDFTVEGEEQITTPAGTFNCIKLTGKVMDEMPTPANYNYTWWLARGIGFVKYEIRNTADKKNKVTTILLNRIELK